ALAEPDLACTEADSETPVCLDGSCVQCAEGKEQACGGETPICDLGAGECVGCSDHGQCPESACNFAVGNCIDPSQVRYVNGGSVDCDDGGEGSQDTPYCTLSEALVDSPAEAVLFFAGLDGGVPYAAAHSVANTKAIFGVPNMQGELPVVEGASMAP